VGAHLDDFGTGYSSLTFLRHFAGNTLKIDRSFIGAICSDDGSAEIVRTIIGLASNLDLSVIAEGIETEAQLRKLHELGGRYGQGFLFARPLAPEGVEELLATWEPERFAAAALN
jgi:EAL domain-containing protein (putative c-di-GMP-specific phosphodiesterase class I)